MEKEKAEKVLKKSAMTEKITTMLWAVLVIVTGAMSFLSLWYLILLGIGLVIIWLNMNSIEKIGMARGSQMTEKELEREFFGD